jgi:hypothetical protein
VRDHVRAVEVRRRTTRRSESQGFMLPTLFTVETDYAGLSTAVEAETARWWANTRDRIGRMRGEDFAVELMSLRKEARDKNAEIGKMQADALRDTQVSVNAKVDQLENGKAVLMFVRDMSASALVVGATFLSGGLAAAALGAGASLKGEAKLQDTGNVGAALLEAGTTIAVGAIGLKGKGVVSDRALLLITSSADGLADATKAMGDGKTTKAALTQGFMKAGMGLVGGALNVEKLSFGSQVLLTQATDMGLGMVAPSPVLGPQPPSTGSVTFARGKGEDAAYIGSKVLYDPDRVGAAPPVHAIRRSPLSAMRTVSHVRRP